MDSSGVCPKPQQVTHDCKLRGGGEPPSYTKQNHKLASQNITLAKHSFLLLDSQKCVLIIDGYPYSMCQQTQKPCQVHSAESVWTSSAGEAGRRSHISERDDTEFW